MLQFETLLLKELQKQQSRDEFCDTVLQTQGVSVPVHSCVLSAFSPRLCGTLSSMPEPMAGQRRLIELQALDACTLVSLVALLYSGQLHGNREQVLCAAKSLGFEFPQQNQAEMRKSKERRREEQGGAEHRVDEVRGREIRESSTQTECGRRTDERETQTDFQSVQTVCLIGQSPYSTSQEISTYPNVHDATLALQTVHAEKVPSTCDVLAIVPEIGSHHTVNESACQIYLYSSENALHQPPAAVTPQPLLTHSNSVVQSGSEALPPAGDNGFEQFEGNIPGFISYFLEPSHPQKAGRQGQGRPRGVARGEGAVKRVTVRSRGGRMGRDAGGGKQQGRTGRWGWVARSIWSGQGGGRVGRKVDTRSVMKHPLRGFQRWRGRRALVNAGEKRGKTGIQADNKGQGDPPRGRRTRGRPRIRPLPPVCRDHKTVASPDSTLLHTTPLTAVPQMEPAQPVDWFLDDLMTGLYFLPVFPAENQHGHTTGTTTPSFPPISNTTYPTPKPTDPKHPPEGELSDILDHFLRTFEQQVAGCSADVGTEMSQDQSENLSTVKVVHGSQVTVGSGKSELSTDPRSHTPETCKRLEPLEHHETPQADATHTSTNNTSTHMQIEPTPMIQTRAQNQLNVSPELEEPSCRGREPEMVKPFGNKKESNIRMITRSQSMKRKLDTALISTRIPLKRKCRGNLISDTPEKKRSRVIRLCHRQSHYTCGIEACLRKDGESHINVGKSKATKEDSSKNRTALSLGKGPRETSTAKRRRKGNSDGKKRTRNREIKYGERKMRFGEEKQKVIERSLKAGRPVANRFGRSRRLEDGRHTNNGYKRRKSLNEGIQGGESKAVAEGSHKGHGKRKGLQEGRHGVNSCAKTKTLSEGRRRANHCGKNKKNLGAGDGVNARHIAAGSRKRTAGATYTGRASPAIEKVNVLLQVQNKQEDAQTTRESEEVHKENERLGNHGSVSEKGNDLHFHPGDTRKGETSVNGEVEAQKRVSRAGEVTRVQEDEETSDGLRQEEPRAAGCSTPFTPDPPLNAAGSSEEDDVDVLEVSSPISELTAASTVVWGAELSTDEEDVEEDVEVDVLGVEAD